jgi:magnesium chelatase family protein
MVDVKDLNGKKGSVNSADMCKMVMRARARQEKRFAGSSLRFNSDIGAREIKKYCVLGKEEQKYMEDVFYHMNLSARSYHKILKVARTIADLEESEKIKRQHLAEAVCSRTQEGMWRDE